MLGPAREYTTVTYFCTNLIMKLCQLTSLTLSVAFQLIYFYLKLILCTFVFNVVYITPSTIDEAVNKLQEACKKLKVGSLQTDEGERCTIET